MYIFIQDILILRFNTWLYSNWLTIWTVKQAFKTHVTACWYFIFLNCICFSIWQIFGSLVNKGIFKEFYSIYLLTLCRNNRDSLYYSHFCNGIIVNLYRDLDVKSMLPIFIIMCSNIRSCFWIVPCIYLCLKKCILNRFYITVGS